MDLLSPLPLAAADLQDVVFIIVFLVVGFVQWVVSLWKQKKEAAERERQPGPTAEEIEARRRAWEEQSRQDAGTPPLPQSQPQRRPTSTRPSSPSPAPSPAPTPTTADRGPLGDLMDSLRRSMEEIQPPAVPTPPPPPSRPPVLPHSPPSAPARAPVTRTPVSAVEMAPEILPSVAHGAQRVSAARQAFRDSDMPIMPLLGTSVVHKKAHPLTAMLRSTHGYKQAFVLREVLGPCKALENDPV